MATIVLAAAAGVILAIVINILADVLPRHRMDDANDLQDPESQQTPAPAPGFFSRLASPRFLMVLVALTAASVAAARADGGAPSWAIILYLALFLLIAVIDIEHRLILNVIMLPAFVLALVEIAITRRISLADALVGYAVGQIAVMAVFLLGAVYLSLVNARKAEPVREVAFGFGDVTLATFCGLVVGYPAVVYMLVLMVLIGGAMAFIYLIARLVVVRRHDPHLAIPYGPAIVAAAALMLLWGEQIITWMLGGR